MSNHFEYCTLEDFRAAKLPKEAALVNGTGEGSFVLGLIREVSGIINARAGRQFAPIVATRYFDAIRDVDGLNLLIDKDLLAITSATNGDGVVITAGQRTTLPKNLTPYHAIRLLSSAGVSWTYATDPDDAISVAGIWGYHDDYANAWELLTTLGAAMTDATGTSATLATGAGNPGELWKIDNEFLYLSARPTTTATLVRGVNGSTAASHLISTPIYRWCMTSNQGGAAFIPGLCKAAVTMKFAIRENPQVESIQVDGHVVAVPKDVSAYIAEEIKRLGLVRI
jgi:hypothetical protein